MSKIPLPAKYIVSLYAGWWMIWVGVQSFLLHGLGISWQDAMTDGAVTQFIVAIAGYTINTSMHSYQPGPRNSIYVLAWSIALSVLCVFLQRWLIGQLVAHPESHLEMVNHSLLIRALYAWLMIVIIAILTWFWVYVNEHRELEKRKDDASRLAKEAELTNLRMQMQPHFLFNSLNSISALIGTRPELARQMIQQLSDFLRGTIKRDERPLITLQEELQHLQLYLDIEKVRFGHRLNTVVHHDEQSLQMKLPGLLLQPVVENAIKFGLYDTLGETIITLTAQSGDNLLRLEVVNPFDPETASPRHGTGFGLNSIRRRLYLLYSQSDLLQTRQEEKSFITTITIPQG